MDFAEEIINRGPYHPGDVIPCTWHLLRAAEINALREELMYGRALREQIIELINDPEIAMAARMLLQEILKAEQQ